MAGDRPRLERGSAKPVLAGLAVEGSAIRHLRLGFAHAGRLKRGHAKERLQGSPLDSRVAHRLRSGVAGRQKRSYELKRLGEARKSRQVFPYSLHVGAQLFGIDSKLFQARLQLSMNAQQRIDVFLGHGGQGVRHCTVSVCILCGFSGKLDSFRSKL